MTIATITTFPNHCFELYARKMLEGYARHWPAEIPLLVHLDDDLLLPDVKKLLRANDAAVVGWQKEHLAFVLRHKGKDHATDYRYQPVRFCHKVFALAHALASIQRQKAEGVEGPRHLIWMDADVITGHPVSLDDIKACLPKEGDAVSYLGRKEWPHSECGWLAFDLANKGDLLIAMLFKAYLDDRIMREPQQHDSWMFDVIRKELALSCTNLTPDAPGLDVWRFSPMGKWSTHHKGPVAKAHLAGKAVSSQPMMMPPRNSNLVIQTQNAIPHEEIREHITKNQELIKRWVLPCAPNEEEIAVVSAGPMLYAEDVREEVRAGRKIVAVKHALVPLRAAGIVPWACILLDPRPHVADFVREADPQTLWFIASQVNPAVTLELIAKGCTVWGYHAAVNAQEEALTMKQEGAIIGGGSATATRGLYLLNHLGFKRFRLYGYDLCYPDKPDLSAVDERGQPKFLEWTVTMHDPLCAVKRMFFTEPQLAAQFNEFNDMIASNRFQFRAFGTGMIPFIIKAKEVADLRREELRVKLTNGNPPHYMDMLNGRPDEPLDGPTGTGDRASPARPDVTRPTSPGGN